MKTATIFQLNDDGSKKYFDTIDSDPYFLTRYVQQRVSSFIKNLGYEYWETEMRRGFAWAPNDLAILASGVKKRGQNEPWINHKFIIELSN